MSDPEILDPEGPSSSSSPAQSAGTEGLVQAIQQLLPGRALRVDVQERPGFGPSFRLEADGKGGLLVVETGPLHTVLVSFGGARFTFLLVPDPMKAKDQIVERVRALVHEELVVLEERATPRLVRTVVLEVKSGRIERIVDSGLEPRAAKAGEDGGAKLSSFEGAWSRAPSKEEKRRIDRLSGGVFAKLKRKIAETVLEKAAGAVMGAVEEAGKQQREPEVVADDGRRKLGK
jgi:hypothetical protein